MLYVPPKAKNINIPAEVTSYGDGLGYSRTLGILKQNISKALPNITIDENNTKFTIIGNGLYEKMTTVYRSYVIIVTQTNLIFRLILYPLI